MAPRFSVRKRITFRPKIFYYSSFGTKGEREVHNYSIFLKNVHAENFIMKRGTWWNLFITADNSIKS
jgi:hypothetical protein